MNTERREHLKNLIRHSTDAKLILPNTLLNDETKCSDKITEWRKEIQEALEYLKQDGAGITFTPLDEDHTEIHLTPKEW